MNEADENPYFELSDDNDLAFLQLEAEFREEFETEMENSNSNFAYIAANYMNKVVAAATALEIEVISEVAVPNYDHRDFHAEYTAFQSQVDNLIIQLRIHNSRRLKRLSVGFTPEQKSKIRALVEKIRVEVEVSNVSSEKKHKLFGILGELDKEVIRDRTRFEYFGDLARGLASLSKEVEKEGAQPWWKWFSAIMGVVDKQKESEPTALPKMNRKRLEPPRKQIEEKSQSSRDFDDEIPF